MICSYATLDRGLRYPFSISLMWWWMGAAMCLPTQQNSHRLKSAKEIGKLSPKLTLRILPAI
jgi:hypothetical protein